MNIETIVDCIYEFNLCSWQTLCLPILIIPYNQSMLQSTFRAPDFLYGAV